MNNGALTWTLNTDTQVLIRLSDMEEVHQEGELEQVLDKLLPSMGRSDIPAHLLAVINKHGHGVLELPGIQRWDGLRVHFRNDAVNLIIDYDAYKSDLSVTSVKSGGSISIDSISELKFPQEWCEEEKVKNKELTTGFSKVNELLGINQGIRAGELAHIPLKWMGESERNPEAIEYAGLPTDVTDQSGLYEMAKCYGPIGDEVSKTIEDREMEMKLRNELRRASDRNNARVGALGEPLGSIDEVIKAKQALADFLRDKPPVKLIVPDAQNLGRLRTIDPTSIDLEMGKVHYCAPRLTMLGNRAPSAEFDGDEVQVGESAQLRRFQWRTRNPSFKAFLEEGREMYGSDDMLHSVTKTNFQDYQWFVKLVRRDIYRNAIFLSPALLIKTLHMYPGIVGADRRTALRAINKTFKRCISIHLRGLYSRSVWELKDRAIRVKLLDWSKRNYVGAVRGMHRRQLITDIRACKTITRQCMTGDDKE